MWFVGLIVGAALHVSVDKGFAWFPKYETEGCRLELVAVDYPADAFDLAVQLSRLEITWAVVSGAGRRGFSRTWRCREFER